MFLEKVGSDPCLVLDVEATLSGTTVTYTVAQKFNFADIVEATKTKKVVFRVTTTDATLIGGFGNVNIADVVALDTITERVYITGTALTGTKGTAYLSQDADTGVWAGTYSIT